MFESFQLLFFRGWYELVFEYFDPFRAFWSAVKYTTLGFAIALALVTICVKFQFFRRQNKYWNIVAKLYFLYIPIVCICTGAGFGTLQYIKAVNDKATNALLQPAKQMMIDYLQGLPPDIRANFSLVEFRIKIQNDIEAKFKDTSTANRIQSVVSSLPAPAKKWLFENLVNCVIDNVNTKISKTTGWDKEALSKLWHEDMIELLKSDTVNDIFNRRIHKYIHGYQTFLLFFLLLFLSVPAIDIIIARTLVKSETRNGSI